MPRWFGVVPTVVPVVCGLLVEVPILLLAARMAVDLKTNVQQRKFKKTQVEIPKDVASKPTF